MKSPARFRLTPLCAVALAAVLAGATAPAGAQCPPVTALANGVSVSVTTDPKVFSVTTADVRWSAVGVRRADAANWDIEARNTTAAFPTCFTGLLATSNAANGIDFLVTDWRFRTPQIDYLGVATPTLTGTSARAEFEQATFAYTVNDLSDHVVFGANDVLSVREVALSNLIPSAIEIWVPTGVTGLKLYVFPPQSSGTGWLPKSARIVEQALTPGGGNHIDVPLGPFGTYAIVVTNEDGVAGSWDMIVKSCPGSGSSFSDDVPLADVRSEDYRAFTPTAHGWSAVAIRGGNLSDHYNWDVAPGWRLTSWIDWTCTDSLIIQQSSGLTTRIIAGDFRSNPLRLYTAHANLELQPKSAALGWMEWEDGQSALAVNAAPTQVNPGANNVIDVWNVPLVKDGSYTFTLVPDQGTTATLRTLVFRNPAPGSPYWATRPDAAAEFAGGGGVYVAPATGLYGVVVVNDDGGSGGYRIGVASSLVGVGAGGPGPATRIRAVAPNPTFAGARVEFALARAGHVGMRVTDVAGRVVDERDLGPHEAGDGSAAWAGRDATGARARAGVYFVTLLLDGLPQDRAKLIVLR